MYVYRYILFLCLSSGNVEQQRSYLWRTQLARDPAGTKLGAFRTNFRLNSSDVPVPPVAQTCARRRDTCEMHTTWRNYMYIYKRIYNLTTRAPVSNDVIPHCARIADVIRTSSAPLLGEAIGRCAGQEVDVTGAHEVDELVKLLQFLKTLQTMRATSVQQRVNRAPVLQKHSRKYIHTYTPIYYIKVLLLKLWDVITWRNCSSAMLT